MNRLRLLFHIIYDNLVTNVILMFISVICAILVMNVFYYVGDRVKILDFYEKSDLDEAILVACAYGQTQEELEEFLRQSGLVGSIETLEMSLLIEKDHSVSLNNTFYDKSFNKNAELSMQEGRMPKAPNEIAIAQYEQRMNDTGNFEDIKRDFYHVGDVITVWDREYKSSAKLTVVGILAKDYYEIKSLNGFLNGELDELWQANNEHTVIRFNNFDTTYAIASVSGTILKDNGERLETENFNEEEGLLIRPRENVSMEELRAFLSESHLRYGEGADPDQGAQKQFHDRMHEQLNQLYIRIILVAIILLLFLYAFLFLRIKTCSTELACYFINGMTWNSSNMIFLSAFVPGILFGGALGTVLFPMYASKALGMTVQWSLLYAVVSVAIITVFVIVSMIPMFFDSKRRHIIDIIRQE